MQCTVRRCGQEVRKRRRETASAKARAVLLFCASRSVSQVGSMRRCNCARTTAGARVQCARGSWRCCFSASATRADGCGGGGGRGERRAERAVQRATRRTASERKAEPPLAAPLCARVDGSTGERSLKSASAVCRSPAYA